MAGKPLSPLSFGRGLSVVTSECHSGSEAVVCSVRKNTKLVPNNTAEGKLSVGLAQRVSCVVQKNTEVVPNNT